MVFSFLPIPWAKPGNTDDPGNAGRAGNGVDVAMIDPTPGVAAFAPYDGESEVLDKANVTETGLVAYLHTEDNARIARMSAALEFGMVAVNRTKITGAPIPFGGVKQAGLGREGSRHGWEAYTDLKYVCRNIA
jgi:aspartate-semialdehyde dehydrogenase